MEPKRGLSRAERNTKEKVRRMQMKYFHSMLAPLVHPHPFKLSEPKLLDHAINYVKQLKERIEELERRKERESKKVKSSRLPVVDIRSKDDDLEINMKCGLGKNFMLHEVISLLQQQGAEVQGLLYHSNGDTLLYTIYSQAAIPRIGLEVSAIQESLKALIY